MTMFRIRQYLRQAGLACSGLLTRLWYESPGALMAAYLMLFAAAETIAMSANLVFKYGWVLPVAFACWRVARGGRIARGILIYVSVVNLLWTTHLTQRWHIQTIAVFAIILTGLAVLLSPAVYARTRPRAVATSSSIQLRPRLWIVLAALLAGSALAGLALTVTRRWFLPGAGCMPGPVEVLRQHCVGIGRGFPVPVLATVHGHRTVSQLAFVQDCVQWTLLLFTAGYLLWLALHRRQQYVPERPSDAVLVAQPSR